MVWYKQDRPRSRRAAFTLIEVLVVVAIIALLVAILLPSLKRAREQSKGTMCLSNLKQFGSATNFYGQDNRDFLPAYRTVRFVNNNPSDPDNFPYWFQFLPYKYLSGSYGINTCPSDDLVDAASVPPGRLRGPYKQLTRRSVGVPSVYYSYTVNLNIPMKKTPVYPASMMLSGDYYQYYNPGKVSLIKNPTGFGYLLESNSSGGLGPNSPLIYFRYKHGGTGTRMNVLFGDSHAEPREIKQIWPGDFTTQAAALPDPKKPGDGKFCTFWYGNPTLSAANDY